MIGSISSVAGIGGTSGAGAASAIGKAAPTMGADFSSVLADISKDAIGTLKAGETAAIQGIGGNMPVQKVVEAIMSAEQTLQTAIAIRDKVVSAYQEVSRMAI